MISSTASSEARQWRAGRVCQCRKVLQLPISPSHTAISNPQTIPRRQVRRPATGAPGGSHRMSGPFAPSHLLSQIISHQCWPRRFPALNFACPTTSRPEILFSTICPSSRRRQRHANGLRFVSAANTHQQTAVLPPRPTLLGDLAAIRRARQIVVISTPLDAALLNFLTKTSDAPIAPGSSNCQDHRCCFSCSFVSLPPQIPLLVRCSDPRRAIRPGRRILRGVNVPPAANFWLHSCKLTLCRPNVVTFGTCRILQLNRHVAHGGMISLFC
jgi:hypothetical protein